MYALLVYIYYIYGLYDNKLCVFWLAIGEMAGERIEPRGNRLIDYLFTKLPKKKVCDRIIAFIRSHRAEFQAETAKYHVTQYLRVPGV